MNMWVNPVWAAGRDWIATLILLFLVILPAIGQFISKLLEAQKEAAKRAARHPKKRARPEDPLEREIAEFLRQVGGEQKKAKPQGRPSPKEVLVLPGPERREQARTAPPSPRRPTASQEARSGPPVVADLIPEEGPREPSLDQHVEQFLRTDQIQAHTPPLETTVSRVEQEVEAHLREDFDQQLPEMARLPLGFSDRSAGAAEMEAMYGASFIPPTVLTGLSSLLATTDSLRDAILFYEIFQPPWQRWGETR